MLWNQNKNKELKIRIDKLQERHNWFQSKRITRKNNLENGVKEMIFENNDLKDKNMKLISKIIQ